MSEVKKTTSAGAGQGYSEDVADRMPLPALDAMDEAQKAAAKALIEGPRKAVFGPFVALLRAPELLDRVGKVGEYLRFGSGMDGRVRELVTCVVARNVSNQFEWVMHAPLAIKAGVSEAALEAVRLGARPRDSLREDEEVAVDFTQELFATDGVSTLTYERAVRMFGERQVVELTTMIGYFVMVSWLMNVAKTPAQPSTDTSPISAFPQ